MSQIVTVLNGDMIGRNHPDTAALLGTQPPHRGSTELVEMASGPTRRSDRPWTRDTRWSDSRRGRTR